MTVFLEKNLQKAPPVNIEKLEFASVCLKWDMRSTFGHEFDLDLSCFLLNNDGIVPDEKDFVFYNNPISSCESVIYLGDNRVGEKHVLDCETINIDFPKVKYHVSRIVFSVTIHDADERNQNFGFIGNSRVQVLNRRTNKQIASYNISEIFRYDSAVIICEFYRCHDAWKFRSLDMTNLKDLSAIAQNYGIVVG